MTRFLYSLLLIGLHAPALAQDTTSGGIEMADALRSSGKIYVVVAVIVIIMAGLFIYLIRLDQKIRKFEKEIKKRKNS